MAAQLFKGLKRGLITKRLWERSARNWSQAWESWGAKDAHDRSISEAKGADGLKRQPKSQGLGTHWSKALLWYRGSKVAPGLTDIWRYWVLSLSTKSKGRLQLGKEGPFWKQATGHHMVKNACLKYRCRPHATSFQWSGHFIIFLGLLQKQEREKHHCMLPQFLQIGVANGARLKSMGSLLTICHCAINYSQNLWFRTTVCYLSAVLWTEKTQISSFS